MRVSQAAMHNALAAGGACLDAHFVLFKHFCTEEARQANDDRRERRLAPHEHRRAVELLPEDGVGVAIKISAHDERRIEAREHAHRPCGDAVAIHDGGAGRVGRAVRDVELQPHRRVGHGRREHEVAEVDRAVRLERLAESPGERAWLRSRVRARAQEAAHVSREPRDGTGVLSVQRVARDERDRWEGVANAHGADGPFEGHEGRRRQEVEKGQRPHVEARRRRDVAHAQRERGRRQHALGFARAERGDAEAQVDEAAADGVGRVEHDVFERGDAVDDRRGPAREHRGAADGLHDHHAVVGLRVEAPAGVNEGHRHRGQPLPGHHLERAVVHANARKRRRRRRLGQVVRFGRPPLEERDGALRLQHALHVQAEGERGHGEGGARRGVVQGQDGLDRAEIRRRDELREHGAAAGAEPRGVVGQACCREAPDDGVEVLHTYFEVGGGIRVAPVGEVGVDGKRPERLVHCCAHARSLERDAGLALVLDDAARPLRKVPHAREPAAHERRVAGHEPRREAEQRRQRRVPCHVEGHRSKAG
mmetsp:Transcript_41276/g.127504  ORF Transcript_41276/g.127504 Transcript_41276/m.127504 type:complete len:536 (+) Transcript_41276:1788-3395(+)